MLWRTHRTKSQGVKRKGMEMVVVVMGDWEHASAFSTSRPLRPWSAFFSNLSITSHPLWQLVLIIRLRGGGGEMDYLPLQTHDPQLLLIATPLLLVIIGGEGRVRLYVFCKVDFMAVSGQMKLDYQQLLRWVINVRTFACRARPSPALHHFQLHLFAHKACALPSNWRLPTHFPPRPHINDTYIVTIAVTHFPISKWSAQAQDSRHSPVLRYVIPPMLGAALRKGRRPWIWWNWPQIVSIFDSPN